MLCIGMYFVGKNKTTTEYFLGGTKARLLGHLDECAGVRYVRLAADGTAGRGISVRHFRWLDRHRPCDRHLSQLAARSQAVCASTPRWQATRSRCRSIFKNRFHDESGWLSVISAVFILVFFLFYTASGFVSCAKLFSSVFGIPYHGVARWSAQSSLFRIRSQAASSPCAGPTSSRVILMFFCVLAVPTIAIFSHGRPDRVHSRSVEAFNPNFLNMLVDGATGVPYTAMGIISLLAWGLGYFGQPHILVRFMGISSPAGDQEIPPHCYGMGAYLADRSYHDWRFRPYVPRRRTAAQ